VNVSKWGNNLAVRLPRAVVERLRLKPRESLDLLDDSTGAAARAQQRRRALDELAALDWALPAGYKFDRDEANSR
jgi:antitoxin MazE